MIKNKLEELVKLYGNKMPTNEFVNRFKEYEPTQQKIYYYLKKNELPTYRECKRREEQFDSEIFNEAKRKIAEITNKKGES